MSDREQRFICIQCPVGCTVVVEGKGAAMRLSGNQCTRGEAYVMQELTNPTRILTTTIWVEGGAHPLLPVRSRGEIPRELMKACVRELSRVRVRAPVKCGEVVHRNVCGTGIDVVATSDMERRKHEKIHSGD